MPTVIKTQTKLLPVFVGRLTKPHDFQARVESFHTTYRPDWKRILGHFLK